MRLSSFIIWDKDVISRGGELLLRHGLQMLGSKGEEDPISGTARGAAERRAVTAILEAKLVGEKEAQWMASLSGPSPITFPVL